MVAGFLFGYCDSSAVDTPRGKVDPCPRVRSDGEVDYFPIHVGDRWLYRYSFYDNTSQPSDVKGELTWEVTGSDECVAGESTYHVQATLDAVVERRSGFDPPRTFTIHDQSMFEITVGESVGIVWFDGDSIPRFWTESAPIVLEMEGYADFAYGSSRSGRATVQISSGTGIVYRRLTLHYSAGGDYDESISLVSYEPASEGSLVPVVGR